MKKHTTVQRTAKLGTGASDENDVSMLNRLASVLVDQDARRITVKPDHRQADTLGPSEIWASSFNTDGKANSVL